MVEVAGSAGRLLAGRQQRESCSTTVRRRFVKIVGNSLKSRRRAYYRREAKVAAALPTNTPAPRLLSSYDDGAWVALVFEDVEGRAPSIPWRRDELARVVHAVVDLGEGSSRRALLRAPRARRRGRKVRRVPRAVEARSMASTVGCAQSRSPRGVTRALGTGYRRQDVAPSRHPRGQRAAARRRVLFVDWPHACVGAAWIDLVLMLPSVAMQGGPPPESVLAGSGLEPRAADVTVVLAGLAGILTARGRLPDPPRAADAAPLPAPPGRAMRSLAARADWLALDTSEGACRCASRRGRGPRVPSPSGRRR